MLKQISREHKVRKFHQAKWDEPIIFELHQEGERGVILPSVEQEIVDLIGDGLSIIPEGMRRTDKANLPEISQNRVLRHYLRLSQETLGAGVNVEIGQGTCTVKYSPIINEVFASSPKMTELHPLQDDETVQGMLEVTHNLDMYMREISGMDCFSFQPGSGTQSAFCNGIYCKEISRIEWGS